MLVTLEKHKRVSRLMACIGNSCFLLCGTATLCNLVARARDPLWENSWGSGKKSKIMHGIHCIPLLSDPVHYASAQYLNFLTMESLQGVENDTAQKNYVINSFKNSCPGIITLNHIESEPVKVFVVNIIIVACLHVICIV